jgi:cytochrome b561
MSLKDTATGYGWVSIALHWITAIVIIYMLYLGSSIGNLAGEARDAAILRHTSLAIASYAVLLGRIVWRFYYGHPGPTTEQRGWAFTFGKWCHFIMLIALSLMLVSGPLMHWSYGNDIVVYGWFVIPSPLETSLALAAFLHTVHAYSAVVVFVGFLLHIGGVYKHTAFNQDGTLAKILFPGRESLADSGVESSESTGERDANP